MKNNSYRTYYDRHGFVYFNNMMTSKHLLSLGSIYDQVLDGSANADLYRSDLSGENTKPGAEKITQIMRPSLFYPALSDHIIYRLTESRAKLLYGDDMVIDFDMMINKLPQSGKPTPWHQDAAYWPGLEDNRALSFWIAIDDTDGSNGCMTYISGSHLEAIRPHRQVGDKGGLECEIGDDQSIHYGCLKAGNCIAHGGRTVHGSLANQSNRNRRALIINYRPQAMVDYLRKIKFDHLGDRENKSKPIST